jgi:hypothetical protein
LATTISQDAFVIVFAGTCAFGLGMAKEQEAAHIAVLGLFPALIYR